VYRDPAEALQAPDRSRHGRRQSKLLGLTIQFIPSLQSVVEESHVLAEDELILIRQRRVRTSELAEPAQAGLAPVRPVPAYKATPRQYLRI
jgi:hypothetical protein